MAKLFISLYVFITLALIGLSAGLEPLFFPAAERPDDTPVGRLLAASHQHADLPSLLKDADIPFTIRAVQDIAWPPESLAQLRQRQALVLYDANLGEQYYLLLDEDKLIEINLLASDKGATSFLWYRSVFFILLGGLIALWLWPLWRDLESLKKSVSNVSAAGNISQNQIKSGSLVAPIAQALNLMGQQVATLLQTQRELSGALAHEFRNPLARLKFALGMQDDEQLPMLKDMQQDVNELEKLVQEMLDFSASEAHQPDLHLAEIPLLGLCQSIITKYQHSHLAHLQVNISDTLDKTVTGDGHFIQRAVDNIIVNACRYARARIDIGLQQGPGYVDLIIEDDGPGVPLALREKIFEPFFRPDEGRTRRQGGAGLGLAIVKRIMLWHAGSCWVSEGQSGGARFTLRFPEAG